MFDFLKDRVPGRIDEKELRRHSVMVALTMLDDEPHVIFEKRSGKLKRQPGEICLPGGSRESGETAWENAMRETAEELCIKDSQIKFIAQMDTLIPGNDLWVDVFMCELTDYDMSFSRDEVETIFTVPLSFFLENKPDKYSVRVVNEIPEEFPFDKIPYGREYPWRGGKRNVYFYYYEDWVIWGLTAYIMQSVAEIIREGMGRR